MTVARRREARAAFGFLLPGYTAYLLFALLPGLAALTLSLSQVDRLAGTYDFVGLENYLGLWADPRFWTVFRNTFLFVALAVTGNVGLGLLLAVLLNRHMPKAILYLLRLAYFLPVLVAAAFVSLIWRFLYSADLGILNFYLRSLGLPAVGWLTDRSMAMLSVVILDVWKNVGFFMIIFLAALQGVPRDLIEAARIDGAGRTTILTRITIPLISPVILFCVTYATIGGLQVFESIRILTRGGPGDATRSIVMYMYEEAFQAQDLGAGAAVACTLLVVIILVVAGQMLISRRWVYR